MIISHRHKFIFIKTFKTASSSMEVALSDVLGPEDIITPAAPEFDQQRSKAVGGQNYRLVHPEVPKIPLWRKLLGRPERYYHPTIGYYEHMPAWRVRRYIGEDVWGRYFKFAFERNPWDRQVSWYHYKTRNRTPRPTFEAFNSDAKRARVLNWDLYTVEGRLALDFIGRYETLEADFAQVLSRIGLAGRVDLPKVNVSKSRDGYRKYYDAESEAMIGRWYEAEIKEFGYSF